MATQEPLDRSGAPAKGQAAGDPVDIRVGADLDGGVLEMQPGAVENSVARGPFPATKVLGLPSAVLPLAAQLDLEPRPGWPVYLVQDAIELLLDLLSPGKDWLVAPRLLGYGRRRSEPNQGDSR